MKNILLATDLKTESEFAFIRAIDLAQAAGATLHVTHVPHRQFHPLASTEAAEWRDRVTTYIEDFVRQHANTNARPCIVHIEDRKHVPEAIVQRARLISADLIVIGRSNRPDVLPDAVFLKTGQILENSPVPVLVAMRRRPDAYQNIILEGDLSVPPTFALHLIRQLGITGQLKLMVKSGAAIGHDGIFVRFLNRLQQRKKERYIAHARNAYESRDSVAGDLAIVFVPDNYRNTLYSSLSESSIDLACLIRVRRNLRHKEPKTHLITALQSATCDVLTIPG